MLHACIEMVLMHVLCVQVLGNMCMILVGPIETIIAIICVFLVELEIGDCKDNCISFNEVVITHYNTSSPF